MLQKTTILAAMLGSLMTATGVLDDEDNPGYAIALAARAIHVSISSCPKNIWTKEDEVKFIHRAAQELGALSDADIEKVTSSVAMKIAAKQKADGTMAKFCDLLLAEKIKMLTCKAEQPE